MAEHHSEVDRDLQQQQATFVDLQCRFMDLELLVSELNEVIIDLGDQVMRGEQAQRSMARRIRQLEQAAPSDSFS